ncbi:hypothetical protein WDV85_15495 [Pseudokineococcus sp. 5B2Z-1]|uniref:hypothetical protein n=1 Tax=Pseudokineococcus sp. 5B2Z-1 TaxID=3132744 RepID=UPI0030B24319
MSFDGQEFVPPMWMCWACGAPASRPLGVMLMVSSVPEIEPVTSAVTPESLSWVSEPVRSVELDVEAIAGAASGRAARLRAAARASVRFGSMGRLPWW